MLALWRRIRGRSRSTIIAAGMLDLVSALIGRFPDVTVVTQAT